MTNHNEESTEHRVLAALREIHPAKRAEVLAVIEAMAAAFPKTVRPVPARPASLSLVVSERHVIRTGKRPRHHQEGVLPALGLRAVLTK